MLILKGLKRLLENVGVLKKPEGNDEYADIDKYEACATTELNPDNTTETNEGGSSIHCE
jgi:hypothetical protein